uniref:BZIP domain-containing protein n=1 Tax=Anabas testudineus TaxID=64144 RepID=A0A7N6FBZ8_ANATE
MHALGVRCSDCGPLCVCLQEREGEGQQVGKMGTKRREKNRDAARKSRRKQTERADELHEELQSIERSNSALQKEIATLNKQLHHYTMALKRHEPYCCLRESASSSSSSTRHSVSPSVGCYWDSFYTTSTHGKLTTAV